MKTKYIKKLSAIAFGITLIFTLGMGQAYGWGSAVHAYIDDQIGKKAPVRNLNEVYGAMAPDTFNFLFSNFAMLQYLYAVTHYQGIGFPDDYLNVWENSHSLLAKAVAFGFVSHNGDFGADLSAHTQSRLYPNDGGYVIKKAQQLDLILHLGALPLPNPLTQAQIDEICHDLIEFAIDIMITQQHKTLAAKISAAAIFRSPEFPFILAKSYANGLAAQGFPGIDRAGAVQIILQTEGEFRKSMISYGQALMQGQSTAIDLIAAQLVGLAAQFLNGLPEGTETLFLQLAKQGLQASMALCAPDIYEELEQTIDFVSDQLAVHGISY